MPLLRSILIKELAVAFFVTPIIVNKFSPIFICLPIGLMNIMLISIKERRHEIGIRRAIGAKQSDIRLQFLSESIILALIGGILGVAIGIFAAYIIAETRHWAFHIFLYPPLVGFTVSVLTGIFFGIYPANKAAKLDPITALRSE